MISSRVSRWLRGIKTPESLILLGFAILLTSVPADAEKYGNTEFFLAKSGIGDIYDLTIDEPSEATPKYWKCRDDPNIFKNIWPWWIKVRLGLLSKVSSGRLESR